MSQQYKTARRLIEDSQLSIFSIFDWMVPYQKIWQATLACAALSPRFSFFLKIIFVFIFIAFIWPLTNGLWRFGTFYIASWFRLLLGKGGSKGFPINLTYVLFYSAWIWGIIVPFVLPYFGGYVTYETVLEWLKVI